VQTRITAGGRSHRSSSIDRRSSRARSMSHFGLWPVWLAAFGGTKRTCRARSRMSEPGSLLRNFLDVAIFSNGACAKALKGCTCCVEECDGD
jgi:hypothetical protein